jgi:hypothetical protein
MCHPRFSDLTTNREPMPTAGANPLSLSLAGEARPLLSSGLARGREDRGRHVRAALEMAHKGGERPLDQQQG